MINKINFNKQVQRRKEWLKNSPDKEADYEWNSVVKKKIKDKNFKKVKLAYNFSKNVLYLHPGLSSNIYFYHPLRVCLLSMKICPKFSNELMMLCLLHNIFETTNMSESIVRKIFGEKITTQLLVLTVDRKNEWRKNYKKKYYSNIIKSGKNVIITKILDKLDNLYLVKQNKNPKVKKRYLKEIEEFILPLIKKELGNLDLYLYFQYLIKFSREK